MSWKDRKLARQNQRLANVSSARGSMSQLGWFLCPNGVPMSYVMSGGASEIERVDPLVTFLQSVIGRFPVIVLHDGSELVEWSVENAWQSLSLDAEVSPLWVANQELRLFEPLFGMDDQQVSSVIRALAVKLGYTATPRLERVVLGHLAILHELKVPNSLSGLSYLCGFSDMGEFYSNVMALPSGQGIWADLGVGVDDENSQFDLFRAVVRNLAHDAQHSGWSPDNNIEQFNCLRAAILNATFVLSVNAGYTNLLLPYLAEELRSCSCPHVLVVSGMTIADDDFVEELLRPLPGRCIGILADNAIELLSGDRDRFARLTERVDCVVVLKHGTGSTAQVLSEVFGKYDYSRVDRGSGSHRGFFSILPEGYHSDVRYSTENRYRVMPEDITALGSGQAIVLNTLTDEVIYYN